MYNELQSELQSEFSGLPDYQNKFSNAYNNAIAIVGKDNAEKLKEAIRVLLLDEIGRYIKSKPKTRAGKFFRIIANLFK